MSTIGEVFPSLFEAAANTAGIQRQFVIGEARTCDFILSRANAHQRFLAERSTLALVEWTLAFLRDALEVKHSLVDGANRPVIDFFRFYVATGTLTHCLLTGQMNRGVDWIALSLSDSTGLGEEALQFEYDASRIEAFLNVRHPVLVAQRARVICTWSWMLYSYCTAMNSLHDVGQAALDPCIRGAREAQPGAELTNGLSSIAIWSFDNAADHASLLARELESLYDRSEPAFQRPIAVALATSRIGDLTVRGRVAWLEICEAYIGELSPTERLLLLLNQVTTVDGFDRRRDELLALIADTRPPIDAPIGALEQHVERNVRVLGKLLVLLARAGRSRDVVHVAQRFYGVAGQRALDDALLCLPFTANGSLWSLGENVYASAYGPEVPHGAIRSLNAALGALIGVNEDTPLPERFGVPDYNFDAEFIDATAAVLGLDQLDISRFDEKVACLPFSSSPFPLQATMLARVGTTWPLTVSLLTRRTDRQIRRVGIWVYGLAYSDQEVNALSFMFEQRDVSVSLNRSEGAGDRERFLALYDDQDVDLLWVIGHGERIAFAPDENSLRLSDVDAPIKATSLVGRAPVGESRRLFVLNVCDGARPTGYSNGLPRMSMAGLCAGDSQAVVSHLWPVRPFAAYAFAIAFGAFLARDNNYWSAYGSAVRALQAGNEAVAELAQINGLHEAAAGLRSGPPLNNALDSYSAAFYE